MPLFIMWSDKILQTVFDYGAQRCVVHVAQCVIGHEELSDFSTGLCSGVYQLISFGLRIVLFRDMIMHHTVLVWFS